MKIYNQTFSDDAMASGKAQFGDIVIAAGQSYFARVPVPYEGVLERLRCFQISGTPVGFTVDVYCSDLDQTNFGSAVRTLPTWAPLFEVLPAQLSAVAGAVIREGTPSIDAVYRNVDGTQTKPERYLYVHIVPAGAGSWELSMDCSSRIGM